METTGRTYLGRRLALLGIATMSLVSGLMAYVVSAKSEPLAQNDAAPSASGQCTDSQSTLALADAGTTQEDCDVMFVGCGGFF